jgi:phosphoribosylformylglycinamidine synthase
MWQFAQAIAGISEACRALGVPITGGNVSLYNETDGSPILPTPVIGVVGVIEDASRVRGRRFTQPGAPIVLLGTGRGELGGSEYVKTLHGLICGEPPSVDLTAEQALQQLLVRLAAEELMLSAHDCAEGGLAVTLAECCFETEGIGAEVAIASVESQGGGDRLAATLFGESASRVIVTTAPGRLGALLDAAAAAGVPALEIGRTGGSRVRISVDGQPLIDCALAEAEARWSDGLTRWLEGRAA